jgi:hypothetical protein
MPGPTPLAHPRFKFTAAAARLLLALLDLSTHCSASAQPPPIVGYDWRPLPTGHRTARHAPDRLLPTPACGPHFHGATRPKPARSTACQWPSRPRCCPPPAVHRTLCPPTRSSLPTTRCLPPPPKFIWMKLLDCEFVCNLLQNKKKLILSRVIYFKTCLVAAICFKTRKRSKLNFEWSKIGLVAVICLE